jgi:hypothetical protein
MYTFQRDNSQTSGIELRKVSHTTLRNQIPLARKLGAIEQVVSRKNIFSKLCDFLQVASSHFSGTGRAGPATKKIMPAVALYAV